MNPQVKGLMEIFKLNSSLMGVGFDQLNEDNSTKSVKDGINSTKWLLAHLTTSRVFIGALAGVDKPLPWDGVFNKNIKEIDMSTAPSLDEIRTHWEGATDVLMSTLPGIDDAKLEEEPPTKFPTEEQSVLTALAFMAEHESYTVGQLSYARRLADTDSLYDLLFKK